MSRTPAQLAKRLIGENTLLAEVLTLDPGGCRLAIRSNSAALLGRLRLYFAQVLAEPGPGGLEIIAIERDEPATGPDTGIDFIDWKREPGKTGRKDSYADFPAARLVRKVRTGMLFLQSEQYRVAAGACLAHDNQVINFINAQYMNWLQQHGWLICHAAALVGPGGALGLAGFSGGGKSTLMLHLLETPGIAYLTNDRLFIRRQGERVLATGIPKLPRVNPGTIVHNPRLHPLIPGGQRERLAALPADELWQLEDKYDVMIDQLYGEGHMAPNDLEHNPLSTFLVLNWQRGDTTPVQLEQVDISQRPELLAAIMKSPGPFLQHADGRFLEDHQPLEQQPYLEALAGVPIYQARGGVDFAGLQRQILERLFE